MQTLKTVAREVFGLFVEDGRFSVVLVLWISFVGLLARWSSGAAEFGGLVLFLGLAAILVENLAHSARRDRRHG
jgi:hypothetical protein